MKKTVVELQCISKKKSIGYPGSAPSFDIELHVGYDQSSIYYQQSGGTNQILKTINQDAAEMFEPGETYVMTLEPKLAVEAPTV